MTSDILWVARYRKDGEELDGRLFLCRGCLSRRKQHADAKGESYSRYDSDTGCCDDCGFSTEDPEPATEVYFVKAIDGGEITAIINEVFDSHGNLTCYAHVGQHGAVAREWIKEDTVPATPEEYAELLKEMTEQVGYKIKVVGGARYGRA